MARGPWTPSGPLSWGAVAVVGIIALVPRLIGLDRESFWLDEAGRAAIAARPLGEIPHAVEVIELSPPLYHLVLRAWIGIAGDGDYAVRLLSALLILPTVALAFALGRAVAGVFVGLAFTALVALNPSAVHYGQEAAMYALLLPVSLFVTLASLRVLTGNRRSRPIWLLLYVLGGCVALYTHYYAGLLLLSTGLAGLVSFVRRRSAHGFGLWLAAHAVMGLAFLPWAPVFLAQAGLAASVEEWGGITLWGALFRWAAFLLADGQSFWDGPPSVILVGAGVAAGCWQLLALRQPPPPSSQGPGGSGVSPPIPPVEARSGGGAHPPALPDERTAPAGAFHPGDGVMLLLLALTIVPLVAAIAAAEPLHSFRERGFLAVAAGPWLLVAVGIAGRRSGRPAEGVLRVCLGLGVIGATAMGLQHHVEERREEWRLAAGLVAYEADPDDPIFFIHFGGQLAFDRYFAGPQPRVGLPASFGWDSGYRAPYRVTPQDVERTVGPAVAGRNRAWVILSHDHGRGSEHLLAYLDRTMIRLSDVQYRGVRVVWYGSSPPPDQPSSAPGSGGIPPSDAGYRPVP